MTSPEIRIIEPDEFDATFDDAGTPMLQWCESHGPHSRVWVVFTVNGDDHVIGGDRADVDYAAGQAKEWLRSIGGGEEWKRLEEADREKYAKQAGVKWDDDIEPGEREKYVERARVKWDDDIEPGEREKFITAAGDQWENDIEPGQREDYIAAALNHWLDGADERRERFLDAKK